MTNLTKEQKREIMERARIEASKISVDTFSALNMIILFLIFVLWVAGIEENKVSFISSIILLAINPVIGFIANYIENYIILKKEEEERIQKAKCLDGCFYQGDIWVIPKQHKGYSEFFENLSDSCEIRYYASFTKEKTIKIFVIINDDAIEFEEIEKADFLDFYQIDYKNK